MKLILLTMEQGIKIDSIVNTVYLLWYYLCSCTYVIVVMVYGISCEPQNLNLNTCVYFTQ